MHAVKLWVAVLLLPAWVGGAPAQVGAPSAADPRLVATLAYLEANYLYPQPGAAARGAAIAVIENGRLTLLGATGVRNPQQQPVTPDTLFRIGSTSKMFTAIALMQLAERTRVDPRAPVVRYTGNVFDTNNEQLEKLITSEMCLTHTTGLKILGPQEPWVGPVDGEADVHYFLGRRDIPHATNPPGPFQYNNLGFCVAGLVVHLASGRPYAEFVQENIFAPLRMPNITFDARIAARSDHAEGFGTWAGDSYFNVGQPYAITDVDHGARWPAGGVIASVRDLAILAEVLLEGGSPLLRRETLQKMQTSHRSSGYGYGFFVGSYRGWTRIYHDGARPGYHSSFFLVPQRNFGVAVLLNGYYGRTLTRLHDDVTDFFLLNRPYP